MRNIKRIMKKRAADGQTTDLDFMMSQKSGKTYSSDDLKKRYNLE